ncbi:MAG: biotin/lipoyl-containing protein [Vicinamibacterales bacterium]
MTFEIEAGGRVHKVAVDVAPDAPATFTITIDGEPLTVDVRPTAEGYSLLVDGRVIDAAVTDGISRGDLVVHLPSVSVPVSIDANRRRGRAARHAEGEQRIVAPMPGRVLRVLVSQGDSVEVRQPVVVIEAMKMENELRATKAGTIKEVAVEPGASVEAGRLLVVIE